jgi:hypothetical protein
MNEEVSKGSGRSSRVRFARKGDRCRRRSQRKCDGGPRSVFRSALSGTHMNRLDAYRLILTQKIDGTQQPGKKTIYAEADPKKVALKLPKLRMLKLLAK